MELIRSFKALSDVTRLRLFYVLRRYELNVNEIVPVVEMSQSGVSRHLRILVDCGLLTSRRDGSYTYYTTARHGMVPALIALIDQSPEITDFQKDLAGAREMIKIRQSSTRRFFKTIAPQWDRIKKQVLGELDLNDAILNSHSLEGDIGDLGCGTGELMEMLALRTKARLIGIDSSPEMLEQARVRLSAIDHAELRLGELEHLPMKNREIGTAILNMVLHHLSQPEKALSEIFRVLKPGGLLILSDFDRHDQKAIKERMGGSWFGFEKDKIHAWLADCGFCPLTTRVFPVRHGLTINLFTAEKPQA